jgi:sec-independent protein translocase protein TatA
MGALQPGHLIVILAIVLIIFGPGKLANLGKSLGEGLRELKKAADPAADHNESRASTVGAGRTCPACHGTVGEADKFCGHCGRSLQP